MNGDYMFGFLKYKPAHIEEDFDLTFDTPSNISYSDNNSDYKVKRDYNDNLELTKKRLHIGLSGDIVLREFVCGSHSASKKAFIVLTDGLSSSAMLNEFVIMPLMRMKFSNDIKTFDNIKYYVENVIPQSQVVYENKLCDAVDSVNFGNAVLFIDGCSAAAVIDTKSWEHRGINTPLSEDVIQGPHEAFNEMLRCNTALLRKSLNTSELVCENITFGTKSKTPASLVYLCDTVNPMLLKEIKRKLLLITDEYILSVFDIEKILEQKSFLFMPQIVTTERPDKVARSVVEGRVALILNGSSHVIILPSNITDIAASPEDAYLRKPYSVFIKVIRIIAMLLSLFTGGVYIALTQFQSDTILTDMYIAIVSQSSKVPFAPLTEILIMEVAFELIKEASIRIPGAIGSSLGIVGGLILGQTAVNAGLVSPIVIIIVSVSGIASFAIPSYSLSFSFRIMRFVYIIAGAICGITGVLSVALIELIIILDTKSLGVPFFVPFSPKTSKNSLYKAIFNTHSIVKPPSYLKSNKKAGEYDEK